MVAPVSGLASGIDTKALVDAMVAANRGSTALLETRSKTFSTQLDLVRQINTKLLSTQLDLSAVRRSSTFAARSVSTSTSGILTATANSSATPGSYQVTVDKVASAQQLSTAGFSSDTASIGTGTVTVGSSTITLNASNSSLRGLAAAINDASSGVTASIINDGSNTPWRLVLTSKQTGANSTVNFDASGLTGGDSDGFKRVISGASNTGTGTVTLNGLYSGASMPSAYALRVSGAGSEATATFEVSTNGGSTWNAVTNNAGTLDFGNGLTTTLAAGSYDTVDTWTLHSAQELSKAQDASIKYGTGSSTLSITSSQNQLTGVIPGVTLNLVSAGTTSVTVGNDTSQAKDAVTTFIKSLNDVLEFHRANASFDADTGKAGPLLSDSSLRSHLDEIVRGFTGRVNGLPDGAIDNVETLGISLDEKTGKLILNESVFDAALAANPDAVARVFANNGTSSNAGVQFSTVSEKTVVDQPFNVDITRAATQSKITGSGALAGTTVITSSNGSLSLIINGRPVNAVLPPGSYSAQQLADQVKASVNAVATAGDQIETGLDSGKLIIRNRSFGSAQTIAAGSSFSASSALGMASTTALAGVDVAGTINGAVATGRGQVLYGATGTNSEGLALYVNSSTALSGVKVTVTKGAGQSANEALTKLTSVDGALINKQDTLNEVISNLNDQVKRNDLRLESRRRYYQAKFLAMEQAMSKFQSLGNALSSSIQGFINNSSSINK